MDIINKSNISNKSDFFNYISNYESLVIFLGFFIILIIAIVISVFFQQYDSIRSSVVFNNINAVFLGLFFMYIVYVFMNEKFQIFGITIDMGLFLFISLAIFIIFILGD